MQFSKRFAAVLAASILAPGCAAYEDTLTPDEGDYTKAGDGKYDSSVEALFVDFEFDGELIAASSFNASRKIQDQLLYTIGHLNGDRSLGRLDRLELSNVTSAAAPGGVKISYHARLPVAWGQKFNVPTSYTFQLPRSVTLEGVQAFTDKYSATCVDHSQAHDVTPGSMWYYYRTDSFGCSLASEDIVTMDATVTLSTITTTGKYPEYHKVWEDDTLRVVAVFGKFEDGATASSDAGISAYNRFISRMKTVLAGAVTTPAAVPVSPGVSMPDITFELQLAGGKRALINVLLVDNVRTAGPEFDARYAQLSTRADLIVYSGHAGLGANIRALAQKGQWVNGQYVVVFMNGCDTYAYVDDALFSAHAAVNPGDTQGTKHVDMVTNAMPAFFHAVADDTVAFVQGLLEFDDPRTFEQIFAAVDPSQVVLVSGEQDNVFNPGLSEQIVLQGNGTVVKDEEDRFQTATLQPGSYTFELTGDNDADLYVRVGSAPTTTGYDCRPFIGGSAETCKVDLTAPAVVHVMVRGWAASSSYQLKGRGTAGGGGGGTWTGLTESGTVAKDEEDRFTTPQLAAGKYLFTLTGTNDADLYIQVGQAPAVDKFDCRPFKSGSNETCSVDLAAPATIHIMVRGWAASSSYQLVGQPQ